MFPHHYRYRSWSLVQGREMVTSFHAADTDADAGGAS